MIQTLHQQNVMRAIAFIEGHLDQSISVDDVCRQVAMSPWQFQRVFRFLVGCSIGLYLRGRRLTEAFHRLIQDPRAKVIDLAYDYQFGSPEAFTRSFKSFFGCLPREAREKLEIYELKKTPALHDEKMAVIWRSIQDISQVQTLGPLSLVGCTTEVPSPFSNDPDFENDTIQAWKTFFSRMQTAQKTEAFSDLAFGVALNSKEQLISQTMRYFASKSSEEFAGIPEGLESFELPEGMYVTFSIVGDLTQIKTLVDYVYAIWLPASEFERGPHYDFEKFDFKRAKSSGLVTYSYNIPVKPK